MFGLFSAAGAPVAAAAAGAATDQPSMLPSILMFGAIIALFYFMIIMPQRKEQKKTQEMLTALKEGDKVVTVGGIVGIITKITDKEDVIQITSGEGTKLNVMRPYISKKVEKPV